MSPAGEGPPGRGVVVDPAPAPGRIVRSAPLSPLARGRAEADGLGETIGPSGSWAGWMPPGAVGSKGYQP